MATQQNQATRLYLTELEPAVLAENIAMLKNCVASLNGNSLHFVLGDEEVHQVSLPSLRVTFDALLAYANPRAPMLRQGGFSSQSLGRGS